MSQQVVTRTCANCGRPEARDQLSCRGCLARYESRPCDACGVGFRPNSAPQRFCSAACRETVYTPAVIEDHTCVVCGVSFRPARNSRSTCSIACHFAYRRRRSVEREFGRDPFLVMLLGDPCVYCGATPTGFDHIEPKVADGTDDWTNLAPCCPRCNSSKCARPLLVHLARNPIGANR